MSWVAAAIAGSAIVGAVASNSAANKQVGAAKDATASQQAMFNTTFGAGQPYRDAGSAASSRLMDLLGLGNGQTQGNFDAAAYLKANPDVAADPYWSQHPFDHYQQHGQGEGRAFTGTAGGPGSPGYGSLTQGFTGADYLANKDPGYDFQLQQGQQALQNSQAAQGGVLSGAALKALIGYNQDYAKTGYSSAFDRYQTQQNNIFSRLGNLATLGQNSAANAGASGASFSNGIAGTITGAGNASAAGTIGMGNAVTGAVNSGMGYYQLNQLLGKGGGGAGAGGTAWPSPGGIVNTGDGAPSWGNNPSAYVGGGGT